MSQHHRPSLRARFVLITGLSVLLVMLGVGLWLQKQFESHVYQQLDATLSTHLNQLAASLEARPEGALAVNDKTMVDPRWFKPYSGLYWQISAVGLPNTGPIYRSRSLWDVELDWLEDTLSQGDVHFHRMRGPNHTVLSAAERTLVLESQPHIVWRLIVAESTQTLEATVASFRSVLFASLLGVLLLTVGGAWLQWRHGLAPLHKLVSDLQAMKSGTGDSLTKDAYPQELQPLLEALDRVLARNREMLDTAQVQAGNLAHGLKTPLAVIRNSLTQIHDREVRQVLEAQLEQAQKHIQWHLSKARAQAQFAASRPNTPVVPLVDGLVRLMQKLQPHVNTKLRISLPAQSFTFPAEPQIIQDMVGNLLDNACRHAKSKVDVGITVHQNALHIDIDDDGPGIAPEQRERVLARGVRLDESLPGSGLGLAIVADLANLYGVEFRLQASPLGGLRAELIWT